MSTNYSVRTSVNTSYGVRPGLYGDEYFLCDGSTNPITDDNGIFITVIGTYYQQATQYTIRTQP